MTGHVWLVGAGPGDPGLLTLAARDALASADAVLHDALIDPAILRWCPEGCEIIDVGKRAGRHSATQAEINELLVEHASAGRRVVRLKGGDPFMFGRGAEEALACRAAGIPFTVVPGVSSAVAGPATAGIPVTHRGASSMLTVVTATESEDGPPVDWQAAARAHTLVVLMGASRIGEVAQRLVECGGDPATPAALVQSATLPGQRAIYSGLGSLEAEAVGAGMGSPAIIVVGEAVRLGDQLSWFQPGTLAGKRVAVTRPAGERDELGTLLRARGADVIDTPVVAIEPRTGELVTDEQVSSRWDWIAFTSANAVRTFFAALAASGRDARSLAGTQVAAIGPATAAILKEFGVVADFVPGQASGRALAEGLPRVSGARVLLPVSSLARDDVELELRRRGAHVERVEIYATVPADVPEATLRNVACADAVTFASPSAVRALAAALGAKELAGRLVSIGPGTSDAVREAFGRVDAEAATRTAAGIATAVEEALTWDS